ncbi:MAG: RNA polymerase sigma factor [Candidatus Melainabacteria bacterium]|nr:RNA polymerase sigma factor [Candidatus Melainabacteria bacterium]
MKEYGPYLEELEDKDLVTLSKINSQHFSIIYQRYLPRIYSYHFYRSGNQQDAEDGTQNTFLKALINIHTFTYRGDHSFSGWLFRIAHNDYLNVKRYQAVHPAILASTMEEELENMVLSPFGNPEQDAITEETKRKVRAAIVSLPKEHKEIIVLRFVADLPNKQIAGITGKTVGAIKAQTIRTLRNLKKELGDKVYVPNDKDII